METDGFAPHFSREELEHSDTAIRMRITNTCPDEYLSNLIRTSWVAEAAREIIGPMRVSSGYRSPGVNAAVGSQSTGMHPLGLAVDVVPLQMSVEAAWALLTADPRWMYQVDQLISESGGNLHIGLPRPGKAPRFELRRDEYHNGKRTYPLIGYWSPQGIAYV